MTDMTGPGPRDIVLTDKDRQLIAILQLDAREPVASLARKLGLSRTTVQDRLQRLEQAGVIEGYSVRLGGRYQSQGLKAFVTIEAKPKALGEVTRSLLKLAEVESLHAVSGKYDLVAMVDVGSTEALDRLLDRIGEIAGVTGTESAVVLSTKRDRR